MSDGSVGGDQDFNDAVFSVSSNPASALATSGIATADPEGTDADGDGVSDVNELAGDTDGDGTQDINDPDDDGDGIVTATEGAIDSDSDGTANYLDTDSDNDGIDDSVEGSVDTDTDGIANYLDTDSDNDGIPSANESGADSDNDGLANYLDTDSDGDGVDDGAAITDVVLTATTRALQANYNGKPLISGDQIEYTVSIRNNGMQTATNVDIDGLIPAHTSLVPSSLQIDGSPVEATLDPVTTLQIESLAGEQIIILTFSVTVDNELPSALNKITSSVSVNSLESAFPAISDNDSTGHSGIEDDGLDHSSDADVYTNDDDPSELPLMQGTVFERCTLAFEDLQNAGWNDWDMNDIILDATTYYVVDANSNIESLVATYQLLSRGAGMDSQLNLTLPYSGYGAWQRLYLAQDGSIEDSAIGSGTDGTTVQLWESSRDALPAYTDLKYQWGAARTERFDDSAAGKIAVVTIYFDSPVANALATFSESPHDTWAYIPGTEQEIHRMKYNLASSQIVYQGPLFGRSLPFVIKLESDFTWPAEGQAIWNSHPDYVPFIKSGGTTHFDWADNIDIWRVWFDREGKMPGREELNAAAFHPIYLNYVNQHSGTE